MGKIPKFKGEPKTSAELQMRKSLIRLCKLHHIISGHGVLVDTHGYEFKFNLDYVLNEERN